MWVLELRSVARSKSPIFGGLLKDEKWRSDATIVEFLEKSWIRIVKDGFVITPKGRNACIELLNKHNASQSYYDF
jgi:hypothetical protein